LGVLSSKMKMKNDTPVRTRNGIVPDNWIYIQEPDVKIGRLQIYNNWSPYMAADADTAWMGMEYFCQEGDSFWNMDDASLRDFGTSELEKLGFVDKADVLDVFALRVKKAYPAYFGSYKDFGCVKQYLDSLDNFYPIGRNGLHRYNNMDHSMLTAKTAVECALRGGGGIKGSYMERQQRGGLSRKQMNFGKFCFRAFGRVSRGRDKILKGS
jgi:protoporphyrinogen oxidase